MSEIHKAYIFCFAATESKNYVNDRGANPDVGLAITGSDIVFDRNDLKSDNWLFCHKDINVVKDARRQVDELNRNCDWIGILL